MQNPRGTAAMASEHHPYALNLNISLCEFISIGAVPKQSCVIKCTCSYQDVCFGMDGNSSKASEGGQLAFTDI